MSTMMLKQRALERALRPRKDYDPQIEIQKNIPT